MNRMGITFHIIPTPPYFSLKARLPRRAFVDQLPRLWKLLLEFRNWGSKGSDPSRESIEVRIRSSNGAGVRSLEPQCARAAAKFCIKGCGNLRVWL